jgi:hypothetical protein
MVTISAETIGMHAALEELLQRFTEVNGVVRAEILAA